MQQGSRAAQDESTLDRSPLAHLLVFATERKLTGSIELSAPSGASCVLAFAGGRLKKIRASEPVAYLGHVLVELGHLSQPAHNDSLLELSKKRGLHGELLVVGGRITREQLMDGLRHQLVRKLAYAFGLPGDTRAKIYEGVDLLSEYGGGDGPALDPVPIIWRGICTSPPLAHVRAAMSRLGDTPVRLKPGAPLHRFAFERDVHTAAERLTAPMRVREFTAASALGPITAELILYCLVITRQLEVVRTSDTSVPPSALEREGPASSPGQMASGAFAVNRLAADPESPSTIRMTTGPDTTTPATGTAASNGPAMLALRKAEILARAARLDEIDFFELLGVQEQTPPAQVQTAFHALAKRWHPDRLPAAIGDVRDACSRVFGKMAEAHKTLTDPDLRAAYVRNRGAGGAQEQELVSAAVGAIALFGKAEAALRRSQYAEAAKHAAEAFAGDSTQADYLAVQAWAESLMPANQGSLERRVVMLDRAVTLNARCERAYFYRAMIHKKLGNVPSALRDFRKAAELNPRNVDAMREIRLAETRKTETGPVVRPPSGASDPPKKGILAGLFKKP